MNLQRNRSLKDISLKSIASDDKQADPEPPFSPKTPKQFKFNIETAMKYINKIDFKNSPVKQVAKYNLSARSHKKFNFSAYSLAKKDQLLSKKKKLNQTDRCLQDKNRQNVQVSKFNLSGEEIPIYKENQQPVYIKMTSPTNRILPADSQPKRPKILNRKQAAIFSEQFKVGKVLGKGRFGNVFIGHHIATKTVFAIKQINLQKICPKLIDRLVWETKIQFFVKHENCLELYKVYKQHDNLYLVLQLGEKSLFDLLRQKRYFHEKQGAYYVKQTIKAFIHLHQNGIIHRDLKPENIVLINNTVKLADFGWAIYIGKNDKRKTFCGTLDYVSPQIVLGAEYDEMVDVWSIGVLCYELCTGHAPFQSNKSRQQTYKRIVNIDLKYPRYLSKEIRDFISKLLIKNPQQRMTLREALQHPWIKKFEKT